MGAAWERCTMCTLLHELGTEFVYATEREVWSLEGYNNVCYDTRWFKYDRD